MKIMMMSNTFTPIVGGLEKSIQTFTNQYRKQGHKVMIVAPEFKHMPKDEVGVVRLPAIQEFSGTDFSLNLPMPGLLSKLMESFKPDIVHAHHPFLVGDLALRLCGQYKIPLVYTYHTMFDQYHYYDAAIGNEAMKGFLVELSLEYAELADHVFAPSESVRDYLKEHGVKTPINVVPTGVNTRYFAKGNGTGFRKKYKMPKNAFVVGTSGRLAPEKNLEFLANSVLLFLKKEKNAHFLIIGKGPLEKSLKKIFREEKVSNRVHWSGILKGKELVNGYHAMDVFVFASQSETQGMVTTEAMAAGVPVVGLDAPGTREVVRDTKNGRLVLKEKKEEFAKAIAWYFHRNASQRKKIQEEAKKTAKEFSIENCADRALQFYELVKIRKFMDKRVHKSNWPVAMNRLKTEWDMFLKMAKATGAAIKETVKEAATSK